MSFAAMMALGMLIDAAIGWPDRVYRRIGHPVTWIGDAISALETRWNTGSARRRLFLGALCTAVVVIGATLPALLVQVMLPQGALGALLGAVLAWPLIAVRSMHDHVLAVAGPLSKGDLGEARHAVSMIVGRDPTRLDQAGVARAAIESLAENTSDGIVAPLFWGAVLGLPGIFAYKAINTLDSMIGHRTERFEHFGKTAARLDDAVNLIPARLTGALFALVSSRPRLALTVMLRDAHQHRSPNAGWPEAAMAGALTIRLSGPRAYGDTLSAEPWVNDRAPDPSAQDITRGLALYRRAMVLCGAGLLGLALVGG